MKKIDSPKGCLVGILRFPNFQGGFLFKLDNQSMTIVKDTGVSFLLSLFRMVSQGLVP
ncbi:MAG: hypothetical protein WBN66_13415 [Smithella sp.]